MNVSKASIVLLAVFVGLLALQAFGMVVPAVLIGIVGLLTAILLIVSLMN